MATKTPGWIGIVLKVMTRYWFDFP